jgi:hypothetical protein
MIISAQYCNENETAVIVETPNRGFVAIQLNTDDPDNELKQEYLEWEKNNTPTPYQPPEGISLNLAESHIASYFTTARLLQMKVWWDLLPRDQTPILNAVYNWISDVTIQAVEGKKVFDNPPNTFDEVIKEIIPLIGTQNQ